MTYTYRAIDVPNKIVSNQIGVVEYTNPETGLEVLPTVNYTYDSVGNISKIQSGTQTAEYAYDDQNQLTQEILPSQTSDYGYDTYGNIRSKTVTDSQGETETYTFTYGNENWLDQLTEVSYTNKNGTNTTLRLTYDAIGNPTSYFNGKSNWEIKWQYGRDLAEIKNKSTCITSEYTYNENGIRESKTVDGTKHDYITLDDKVIRETYENALARGDKNVWFIPGTDLIRDEIGDDWSVDGTHPTDLGFFSMAKAIEPTLKEVIEIVKTRGIK